MQVKSVMKTFITDFYNRLKNTTGRISINVRVEGAYHSGWLPASAQLTCRLWVIH